MVKGQPLRFLHGHNRKRVSPSHPNDMPKVSERARRLVNAFFVAAHNVGAGYALAGPRDACMAALLGYVAEIEERLTEAVGEWENLLGDRRTLMRELAEPR